MRYILLFACFWIASSAVCDVLTDSRDVSPSLLQKFHFTSKLDLTRQSSGVAEQAPIDFVYCWAGEETQQSIKEGDLPSAKDVTTASGVVRDASVGDLTTDHVEGFGFNEMQLSLRSLQLYAPWFNKVYLLVNGPSKVPSWAADDPRVEMVDRCGLFPKQSDCPTKNSAACESVGHLVPGLKEQFVFMMDDVIFVDRVVPSDFFSADGKPLLTSIVKDGVWRDLYGGKNHPSGPDMPPAHMPVRLDYFAHKPLPLLVNFCHTVEGEFPEWFSFVRSHKLRFTCCDASVYDNGLEEEFHRIYPAMLFKYGAGVNPQPSEPDSMCNCDDPPCIEQHLLSKKTKTVVVQNCHTASAWNKSLHVLLDHMKRSTSSSSAQGLASVSNE